jgi:hypothetical protein
MLKTATGFALSMCVLLLITATLAWAVGLLGF